MNDPFERALLREKLERRERRTRHVAAWFRTHVMIFVVVNAGLFVLWLVERALDDSSSSDDTWFFYSFATWAIILAVHGWQVHAHMRRDALLRARLDESGATS